MTEQQLRDAQKVVRAIDWVKEIQNPIESRNLFIDSMTERMKILSPERSAELKVNEIADKMKENIIKAVIEAQKELEEEFNNL